MNISDIYYPAMCCGCGFCGGVCPTGAIEMEISLQTGLFYPKFIEEKCINCDRCVRVCPGYKTTWKDLNKNKDVSEPTHDWIGSYKNLYSVHAVNENVRMLAASGGAISSLLIHLIDSGEVSGVVLVKREEGNLWGEGVLVTQSEEVLNHRGSQYCPVNFQKVIQELDHFEGSVAFVGLPCHMMALHKLCGLKVRLKDKVKYKLALFCGKTPSYWGLKNFLPSEKYSLRQFRGHGWPGFTEYHSLDGGNEKVPFESAWDKFGAQEWTPLPCFCCYDFVGEFSDISFGDDWTFTAEEEKLGKNLVLSISKRGQDLIDKAFREKVWKVSEVPIGKLFDRFFANFFRKKLLFPIKKTWVKGCPQWEDKPFKLKFKSLCWLVVFLERAVIFLGSTFVGRKIVGSFLGRCLRFWSNKISWRLIKYYKKAFQK